MYSTAPVPVLDFTNTSLPSSKEGITAFCTLQKKKTVIIISEKGVVTCMLSKMSQAYQTKTDLNKIDVHKHQALILPYSFVY